MSALRLRQAVTLGLGNVLQRNRLRDETEDEGHHSLASLRLVLFEAQLVVAVAFFGLLTASSEFELGHAQAIVPGLVSVVVEAARIEQFLMKETLARAVFFFQCLQEDRLHRSLAIGGREEFSRGEGRVMLLGERLSILEGEALGIFLSPFVQPRTDRLGRLEAGDIVARVTTQPADGLLADVPLERVGRHISLNKPTLLRIASERLAFHFKTFLGNARHGVATFRQVSVQLAFGDARRLRQVDACQRLQARESRFARIRGGPVGYLLRE